MSAITSYEESLRARPKRADARRNYDTVIAAAREAFAAGGRATSLEEIARQAGVGIGTLYRHFPNRQALLEAVYVEELEGLCASTREFAGRSPWEALEGWLHSFVGYMATKQALATELTEYLDRDSPLFLSCRGAILDAGAPLLERAQAAGAVRADVDFSDLLQLVGGIAKMNATDPERVHHVLGIALDGLRYRD